MSGLRNVINSEKRFVENDVWEEDSFLRSLDISKLLNKNSEVLEIGCGDGVFSEKIADIVGNFVVEKRIWSDISIEQEKYINKFDMVFCNTSGSINTIDDLKKMNESSKGMCILSDYISVSKPFEDEIEELICTYPMRKRASKMSFFYSYLREKSYIPDVDYYERDDTLEFYDCKKAVRYFKEIMEKKKNLSYSDFIKMHSFINSAFYEGMLVNPIHSIMATLVWRVDR